MLAAGLLPVFDQDLFQDSRRFRTEFRAVELKSRGGHELGQKFCPPVDLLLVRSSELLHELVHQLRLLVPRQGAYSR